MKSCFLTLFVLCVATGISAQTVRRVVMTTPAGSDDSGASWANATSLHNALFESVSGDMIWLKAGTYTPVNESRPRDAFFHVPAGVALYGGFAGTETSLSDRNLSATGTTFISGEIGMPGNSGDNIIQLITVAAGAQVTLDNLTIADANSLFSENSSSSRTGAGVYAPAMADLLIRNCLFRNNSVKGSGGAVYGATGSNLTVIGSTFTGNSAVGNVQRFHAYGGAVYGDAITITGSTFTRNSAGPSASGRGAGNGGAVYGNIITITGSIFTGNRVSGGGGQSGLGQGGAVHAFNMTVTSSTFIENSAYNGSYGGAVSGRGQSMGTLANNIFWGNTAFWGSQVYIDGVNNTLRMTHNLVQGGSGGDGLLGVKSTNEGTIITASSLADIFLSTVPGSPGYLWLKAGSPAVNSGSNDWIDGEEDAYETGDETGLTDLAGNSRLTGSQVDLGAYEYDATLPLLLVTTAPAVTTGLAASGGKLTASIDLSGGATGWTATTDDSFITLSPESGTGDGTLTISYTANNSGGVRTGSVTIATTGGTGDAFTQTLTLTQTTVLRVVAIPPASSDNSGGSWVNAMSLHAALEAFHQGDTIWMKAGSYTPVNGADGTPPEDARDAVFLVPAGVALYGGFAGTETSLSARNLSTTDTTFISGEIGTLGENTDNIRRLITVVAGAEVTLDGLTIADAYNESDRGAGVYALGGLRIRNCLFRNNKASGSGGAVYRGGILRSNLTITSSTFTRNSAGTGGAVYGNNSSIIITGSTFTGNRASGSGGAVFGYTFSVTYTSSIIITGSTFTGNRAGSGAGAGGAVSGGYSITTGSTFTENSAYNGGAVSGGSFITSSTFTRNSAYNNGGAVYGGSGTLANNIFWGNTASASGNQVSGGNTMRLTHNLVEEGSAGLAGITAANRGTIITASSFADIFLSTVPGSPGYLWLKAGSPAVNSGNNDWIDGEADAYETGDETGLTDLAGNPRLAGNQVDLGAYEYDATLPVFLLTTDPAVTTRLPVPAGTITATIDIGGSATGWTATTDDSFITLSLESGTGDGTLTIGYTANNSGGVRAGSVTIATTGGTGDAFTHTLTLTQQEEPRLLVTTDPAVTTGLPATAGTITATIDIRGSATGWTATTDDSFITLSPESGTADGTLTISYAANNSVRLRTGNVMISTTGGTGDALTHTLTLTQQEEPGLLVTTDPAVTTGLPATAGTITATIDIRGSATGWTATTDDSFITLSQESGTADGTLTISYTANNSVRLRTGNVTINTTGGTGDALTHTLTLTQQEGGVLGVLPSVSSITFTNPSGGVLYVRGISKPVSLIIRSVSGKEQFRTVLSTGSDEADIRTLSPGLYLLTFETADGRQTERLLKR